MQSQLSSAYQVDVDDEGDERDAEEEEEAEQRVQDVACPERPGAHHHHAFLVCNKTENGHLTQSHAMK